jgi:hypothetical protein
MDLTRRALIAGGLSLGASAGIAASAQNRSGRIGFVTPGMFGAVSNDPRFAIPNVRAFNAMAEQALAAGLEIVIPRGVWFLEANGAVGTGWDLRPGPVHPWVVRGEGPLSLIRRAPTVSARNFSAMIRLWVTSGHETFDLEGFAIDGNEQSFPYEPGKPYAYQQSHCVVLVSKSPDRAAARMKISDISLSGVVADGFKIGAQCDRFEALRITASGRVRRMRSDIQFSRIPRLATVTDCEVDAFESEPSRLVESALMQLKNVIARASFDLAGPEGRPARRLHVIAENCRGGMQRTSASAATSTNFYRLEGTFTNCAFATSPARDVVHSNVIRGSALRFQDSQFHVGPGFGAPSVATPLFAHFERAQDSVAFVGCRFAAARGVSGGSYLGVRGNSPPSLVRLENCRTERALDTVIDLKGPARVQLAGGTLRARKALIAVAAKAAPKSDLRFDRDGNWAAPKRVAEEVTPPRAPYKP